MHLLLFQASTQKGNTDAHSERANANIAQLLRRFENIIAFTPVRIALIFTFMMIIFELMRVEFWSGLGWACLGSVVLCAILGI